MNEKTKQDAIKEFEARFGDQSNVIRIGFKPSDLKGIGTEYLVLNHVVLAKFYNGALIYGTLPSLSTEEITKVS